MADADRGGPARKRQRVYYPAVDDLRECARILGLRIREEFDGVDLHDLSSTATWKSFTRPVLGSRMKLYDYMGRETTKTMVDFITTLDTPLIMEQHDIMYVVGTPGCGKTTSMAATFGYLYTKFAAESPRQNRILYLKGQAFTRRPSRALFHAILVAFADVELTLDGKEYEALQEFLETRREDIYLLFDDGNALDGDDAATKSTKSNKATPEQRAEADTKLYELSKKCITVVCASVRSWLVNRLKTDKAVPYKLFAGGFTDAERVAYLKHYAQELSHADLQQTSSVPRLLFQFMFEKEALKNSLRWYEEAIKEYIDVAIRDAKNRSQLCEILTGNSETEQFSETVRSGCFFRGPFKRVECLTTHLQSYALGYLAISSRKLEKSSARKEIGMWTETIRSDSNVASIGWKAAAATITAFSLLPLEVDCVDFWSKQAVEPNLSSVEARELCSRVLKTVNSHPNAIYFREPVQDTVSEEVLARFNRVVKRPMDLGTISRMLKGNGYENVDAFRTDMELVFRNVLEFYVAGDAIHTAALHLRRKFLKELTKALQGSVKDDGTKLVFKPERVIHFEGKFDWSIMLQNDEERTLYVPKAFDHYGADLYFSDAVKVVIIQVTVRRNGRATHVNTRRLMQSCPATEKRRKIILWVLPNAPLKHEKVEGGGGYEEVQVSFSKLHEELFCIDDRCASLRSFKQTDCVYCRGGDAELPCSSCLYWFHQACAEADCSESEPFNEPFECRYCRTKGERLFDFRT